MAADSGTLAVFTSPFELLGTTFSCRRAGPYVYLR